MRPLDELQFYKRSAGVSEDDLRRLEERIGLKLPGAYKELLRYNNGGHPQLDVYPHEDDEWNLNNFFTVGDDESTESIWWNYRNKWPEASPAVLPFARDGGGNLFSLDLTDSEQAPVIVWLHDPPNVLRLADSFEEFIDGLREFEDEDEEDS